MATTVKPFSARHYGPDLPPAGQDAMLHAAGGRLRIDETLLPDTGLSLRRCGFDEQGLELAWQDASGRRAVQVLDAQEARRLLEQLPASLLAAQTALRASQRKNTRHRGLAWAALALFLAAPLLLLAGFYVFSDAIAGAVAKRIPLSQERRLGEISFASLRPQLTLRDDTEAARKVREIGARLTAGSRYRYEFHLVQDPAVNAFALPGGIVVVNTGLLTATRRPEELAGVLAHEVQHVELRHSLKGIVKQSGLAALWAFATGDLGGSLAAQAGQEMLGLKFSRDAERDADAQGLDALIRAQIDPSGLPDFFRMLAAKEAALPALLSTHPQSDERQSRLAALLRERAPRAFPPLAYSPWPPGAP